MAIMKTLLETSPNSNLNISKDEIKQTGIDTSNMFMGDQYRVKRICTKKDNDLKAIMVAHLEKRASEQASHYI